MARQKGMLNLSGNLEPLAGAPLDSRDITPTVADLYIASNWPYKYIGMKTTVTATGDTYRLVNLDVTKESSWVKEGSESGQTIQYDELPAASSTLVGKIYQYTGVTNVQYTNGYFYECVLDGGTYKWVQTNTQPGTSYNDFTGATSQAAGAHGLVPAPTTGDIAKFLKGDGTWATVPMPSFDYSNTSPEAMNFSTDEKVIGTWIDGKPLYQKVVNWGTLPSSTGEIRKPHGISNVDKIISTRASGIASDGTCIGINGTYFNDPENPSTQIDTVYADRTNITVRQIGDRSSYNLYATLRYTKTTDSAVASGEKIVGQWIDGKPVYQKTIYYRVASSSSDIIALDDSINTSNATLISVDGVKLLGTSGDTWQQPLSILGGSFPFFGLRSNGFCFKQDSNNTISVGADLYITIQYTKIT